MAAFDTTSGSVARALASAATRRHVWLRSSLAVDTRYFLPFVWRQARPFCKQLEAYFIEQIKIMGKDYAIQFKTRSPFNSSNPPLFREPSHKVVLLSEIQGLLLIGAINEVPKDLWDSNYFLMPKKDGAFCPVLDIKELNTFICKFRSQMLSLTLIVPSLSSMDWFKAL